MSNAQLEEAMELRQDEHIAGQLDIMIEVLDDDAPEGVTVYGEAGSL